MALPGKGKKLPAVKTEVGKKAFRSCEKRAQSEIGGVNVAQRRFWSQMQFRRRRWRRRTCIKTAELPSWRFNDENRQEKSKVRIIKVLFISVELILFIDRISPKYTNMYAYICTRTYVRVQFCVFTWTLVFLLVELYRTLVRYRQIPGARNFK